MIEITQIKKAIARYILKVKEKERANKILERTLDNLMHEIIIPEVRRCLPEECDFNPKRSAVDYSVSTRPSRVNLVPTFWMKVLLFPTYQRSDFSSPHSSMYQRIVPTMEQATKDLRETLSKRYDLSGIDITTMTNK